jgi:ATP adenylyltransferase
MGSMSSLGLENLRLFLLREMRLSHVYQPLMIRTMLSRGGRATTREIAAAFLAEDESQLDYYGNIVQRMPGAVLRLRGVVERDAQGFALTGEYRPANDDEVREALNLCDEAIAAYKTKRGDAIWQHRAVGLGASHAWPPCLAPARLLKQNARDRLGLAKSAFNQK